MARDVALHAVGAPSIPLDGDMKTLLLSALILSFSSAALAQDKTVTLPEDKIVVKAPSCTVRALDQGRGNVRICQ